MKRLALAFVALLAAAPLTPAAALEEPSPPDSGLRLAPESIALATYHGQTIDLREGWGDAQACHTDEHAVTTCFDSEAEMDEFLASGEPGASGFRRNALTNCSTSLRLYDNISYGTPVWSTLLRFNVISLSTVGFDNRTTSYRVGACSATFWQGAAASGAVYPGNTSAGAQFPNMVTGWNNTVSSVYLA
ncbi:MAG: hypothetical protein AB7L17_17660 [Ilumatobacteraceae bacterium]